MDLNHLRDKKNNVPHIILVGLFGESNLGDPVLFEATRRMIEECCIERGEKLNIIPLNMYGIYDRPFLWRLAHRIMGIFRPEKWRYAKRIYHLASRIKELTKNKPRAIIFAGGGIIKYKYQDFPALIAAVIRQAEKQGIPVMFSAVGVEGFSLRDSRCRYLMRQLNKDCVKVISTRDDLATLRHYVQNPTTRTVAVADSACSLYRLHPVDEPKNNCIGLGICRDRLFPDNDIDISPRQMENLWVDIYTELAKRNHSVKLFTNGLVSDDVFAQRVAKRIEEVTGDTGVLLPRPQTCDGLIRLIKSFRAIIATRLHSTIIAYSYDVPFVGLVWNDKQTLFGEIIGRSASFIRPENFNAEHIGDVMETALLPADNGIDKEAYAATTKVELARFLDCFVWS